MRMKEKDEDKENTEDEDEDYETCQTHPTTIILKRKVISLFLSSRTPRGPRGGHWDYEVLPLAPR